MLALFFGLVALCAVFFGMGFSLGKNSAQSVGSAQAAMGASSVRPRQSRLANRARHPTSPFIRQSNRKTRMPS